MGDAAGHAVGDDTGDNSGLATGGTLGYARGLVMGPPSARSLVRTPDWQWVMQPDTQSGVPPAITSD